MKKFFTFFTFIMALIIVNSSYAIDPGFYIGAGGSYAQQNFDINNDVSNVLNSLGLDDEFNNTSGVNLKVGYRVNDISSWELNLDFLPGFKWPGFEEDCLIDFPHGYFYASADLEGKVNITTLMFVSKIAPNFGSDTVRPFVTAGIGIMRSELEVKADTSANASYNRYSYRHGYKGSLSESDISVCFKLGTGVDFFVKDNLSLGFEVAYILGTGSLSLLGQDIIDELKYMNYTFGVAYYF